VFVCLRVYIHTHRTHTRRLAHMDLLCRYNMCVCTCVCMYVYICFLMCVCACIYTYIHILCLYVGLARFIEVVHNMTFWFALLLFHVFSFAGKKLRFAKFKRVVGVVHSKDLLSLPLSFSQSFSLSMDLRCISWGLRGYGVATISRLDKIIFFFCRISSLYRALLQKRPIISSILLTPATP